MSSVSEVNKTPRSVISFENDDDNESMTMVAITDNHDG